MRTCWYGEAAHRWPASWHVDGAPKPRDVPVVVQRRGDALDLRVRCNHEMQPSEDSVRRTTSKVEGGHTCVK